MPKLNRLAAVTITVATIVTACNSDDTATTTTNPSVITASTPATNTSPTSSSTTPETTSTQATQPPTTSTPTTQPPASSTPTTQPSTTEPTNPATPTSTPPPTAPPQGVAIDDWDTIIETLDARRLVMVADLDASDERVLQACTFDGTCADEIRQIVASYTADGLRPFYTNWTDVVEAEVTVMDGDTLETSAIVRVETVTEAKPAVIGYVLRADGTVAYDLEINPEDQTRLRADYWLARSKGDSLGWRIIRIDGDETA